MNRRRIVVLTGSRAEYGLLFPIMQRIKDHPRLELVTMVTGMHLSPQYGLTYKQIEKDGFKIDSKIEMLIDSDTNFSAAKSAAIGLYGIAQELERLNPDILLVYGDRIEALIGTFAAAMGGLPVAHIQGGDMVHGIHIDDSIRNAITRFAHIHFAVLPSHARRLRKMGEEPFRIHTVGFPGLEEISYIKDVEVKRIQSNFGIRKDDKYFIVVVHPTTLESENSGKQMESILRAATNFPHKIITIYPNSDSGGKKIIDVINAYAKKNRNIIPVPNLARRDYLTLLGGADALIGNSSSMIFDAPELGIPSVSIGWRQRGRLKHKLIHEIKTFDETKITSALKTITKVRKHVATKLKNNSDLPSERIVKVLNNIQIDKKLLMKNLQL